MKPATVRRAAMALVFALVAPAAAQRAADPPLGTGAPSTYFPPQANSPQVQQTQTPPTAPVTPKFELPSTFPSIPSGVAVIPPTDSQGQRPLGPAPSTPLPTTTPMPPADVATPIVLPTIPPAVGTVPSAPAPVSPVPAGAQRPQAAPAAPAPAPVAAPPAATVPPVGVAPAAPPVTATPVPPVGSGRPDILPIPAPLPTAGYPMFTGTGEGRSQLIRLRDIRGTALHLEGAAAEGGVAFTTRQDDAFVAARISLVFSYSNAVARDDGELAVFLNNEPIGTVPLGKARGPKARAEFTFTPALLTTDNRLQFRFTLKGQGATACKVDRDKAIWVNIEPATFIFLSTTRLPLADDLSFLPRPFADPKDPLPLSLPFVLPAKPEPGVIQAAGMVAGYFGLIAGAKGATFPVQYTGLPAGNAVVLVEGGQYPAGIAAIPGEGPRVAVIANPSQVDSKLLLIVGENAEELQAAAGTLATATARLTGGWSPAAEPLPPPRPAYDAPKWIPSNRPVRLGELAHGGALNGRRLIDSPQISFRTAPDLFFGALSGGTMYLHIRRADDSWIDAGNSRVFVDLNRKVVGEIPLEPKLKVLSRLKEWLFPGKAEDRVSQVLLPGFQLASQNHLDFMFELRAKADADCEMLDWSDRTGIDPNSTIDLSRVAHFAAFPNLALFANAGFPFTRYADLATTAFVMPETSAPEEVQAMLNLLGMMADATGVAPTRFKVADAAGVDQVADRDLIVIGLQSSQPLLREWGGNNSLQITGTSVTPGPGLTFLQRQLQPTDPRAPYYRGAAPELAKANLGKPYAYLSSFWSPLNADQLVVMVGSTQPANLVELSNQLGDPEQVAKIQGDFYYLTGGKGEFYTSGIRKFVGGLPIWWRIQWLAGSFELAAFICVICVILIFAVTIERLSAHRANRILVRGLPNPPTKTV
ncbi:cellulose biosynthesis cyclic di-GMP-binding regulatory protein BcsB [Reyranella aquatilis]|uniref:Cyclic di-GMP-binding protein n=1 Tax=Reyranella aquatilis TaxID=2035356 RepID=A0ABS8KUX8_9HYPH|nr:cellulose biosynthesis cyclic di-GMP-binding regulatory protein BcsB [Reyranella aquatilis]MCC8429875.1 cellulose biosynthesis cyclic di-GMP-binding regulatory protein BcsB [Reyranella aquatilis]